MGIKGPRYKKFNTRAEAEAFVAQGRRLTAVKTVSVGLDDQHPEKRQKTEMISRSAPGLVTSGTYIPNDANGNIYELGTGPLPPGAEDGFDPNIKLTADGRVVSKTEDEKARTKLRSKERDPPGMLRIYTDGSSLRNGTAGARAGVGVFFGPEDPKYVDLVSPQVYPIDWTARGQVMGYGEGTLELTKSRKHRNVSEALKGSRQTNQRAELTAIVRALEIAPRHRDVTIYTDSRYAIDCVTNWYKNWVRNDWQNAKGKPVENKDLIQDVREKMEERELLGKGTFFVWVKGHSSDEGNIAADKLANAGASLGRGPSMEEGEGEGRGVDGSGKSDVDGDDGEVEEAFKAMDEALEEGREMGSD